MTIPAQDVINQALKQCLKQCYAGIQTELPDQIEDAEIQITFSNRSAEIELEEGNMKVEQSMLASRIHRKVEQEAERADPANPEQGLEEEVAPMNDMEPDSSQGESEKKDVKSLVKDKV